MLPESLDLANLGYIGNLNRTQASTVCSVEFFSPNII
jgi:hypothetical protein